MAGRREKKREGITRKGRRKTPKPVAKKETRISVEGKYSDGKAREEAVVPRERMGERPMTELRKQSAAETTGGTVSGRRGEEKAKEEKRERLPTEEAGRRNRREFRDIFDYIQRVMKKTRDEGGPHIKSGDAAIGETVSWRKRKGFAGPYE